MINVNIIQNHEVIHTFLASMLKSKKECDTAPWQCNLLIIGGMGNGYKAALLTSVRLVPVTDMVLSSCPGRDSNL